MRHSADKQITRAIALTVGFLLIVPGAFAQEPVFEADTVLPFQDEHVHGSTLAELPNGDLLVAWFQGSGERWADDVRIMGARKKSGGDAWSDAFVMADVDAFPDINPVLFVDTDDRLWLFWYTVIANQWETSLLKYRISEDYLDMEGAPSWDWQEDLLVKPGGKTERGIQPEDPFVASVSEQLEAYGSTVDVEDEDRLARWMERTLAKAGGENMIKSGRVYNEDGTYTEAELGYPYFRRMGWQTRAKPFVTEAGRILLPLYSDGFSFSLMAFTDDRGETWQFSTPLVGPGNIQPTIARTRSGDLVAYMRDNGPAPKRLHVSTSTDDGETWSIVQDSELPNPGSAADIVTLENGHWVLIYNDTERGRHSLAVSLSEDEGATWPWTKKVELDESEQPITGAYPAIIQGSNGNLHATYSYQVPNNEGGAERKTVKYITFNEAWIKPE